LYVAVVAGQFAYVLIAERFRPTAVVRNAALASGLALAAFSPWLVVIALKRWTIAGTLPQTASHFSPLFYAGKSLLNIALSFFATTYFDLAVAPIAVLVALFSLLTASRVVRSAPRATVALGCLAIPTILATFAWDVARHQNLLLFYRYETPLWLALQLAVAGGLAWNISRCSGAARGLWSAAGVALLAVCATSSALAVGQRTFWDSWFDDDAFAIAKIVHALPHPLVIIQHDSDGIFVFANALRPDTRIRFSKRNDLKLSPSEARESSNIVFLTAMPAPPPGWQRANLQQLYTFDFGTSLVVGLRKRYHLRALAYGTDPFQGSDTLWRPLPRSSHPFVRPPAAQ